MSEFPASVAVTSPVDEPPEVLGLIPTLLLPVPERRSTDRRLAPCPLWRETFVHSADELGAMRSVDGSGSLVGWAIGLTTAARPTAPTEALEASSVTPSLPSDATRPGPLLGRYGAATSCGCRGSVRAERRDSAEEAERCEPEMDDGG